MIDAIRPDLLDVFRLQGLTPPYEEGRGFLLPAAMPQVKHKKKSKVKQLCSAYAGVSTVPVLEHAAKQMKWRLTDNPHPTASE